ncbi:BBT_collapsed_G0051140.mRNA.1.CDS.1 [Saccharomyces cerevisiae]|nr:BBT_collapsed_G0051140.mRNA.1.CDS.1 [Saccharomyces cerevisiae]
MSKFSLKLGSKTLKKNISKKTKKKNSLQKANLFDWDDAETASLSHKPQSKIKIQSIDKFDLDEESSSKKKLVIKLSENADTKKTMLLWWNMSPKKNIMRYLSRNLEMLYFGVWGGRVTPSKILKATRHRVETRTFQMFHRYILMDWELVPS